VTLNKPFVGVVLGAALGALDGASAWFSADARPIIVTIIIGSTIKGVITGLLAGLIARWRQSTMLGVVAGLVIGFALSHVAALGQPGHYAEIVLPGMLLGAIVGFVTQRYPRTAIAASAVVLAIAISGPVLAQQAPADNLAPIAPFIGRWTGTSEGQPGKGTIERDYERALGSRFIRVRNRSTYPPQEKNPKGEVHEDEGFFSFDRARKRMLFRQFHIEGFVTTYVHDVDAKPGTVSFTTEAIENIPPGWRARETYILHSPDDLEEIFELAEQGKDFALYSRTRLRRAR
jgi:hypothetical protein